MRNFYIEQLFFDNVKSEKWKVEFFYYHFTLWTKETLIKSFLPFVEALSVKYFRAFPHTAKRMLRINQLFPNNQ